MIGCRYALSTVVEKRSNSRYSATTSAEHVTAGDPKRLKARQDGGGLVTRLGRNLGDDDLAGCFVDRGQIGKRAADIDPDYEHARGAYETCSVRERASSMAADRSRS